MSRGRVIGHVAIAGVLLGLFALVLVFRDPLMRMLGKSWAITYEAGGGTTGDIEYTEFPSRYRDESKTVRLPGRRLPWSLDATVNAGRTARLLVAPAPNTGATCRIVLDKTSDAPRVLATGRSAGPGKPAVCEAATDP
ncbi:MmpS family transport accessory protein [Spirillospora sp. CA-253888]